MKIDTLMPAAAPDIAQQSARDIEAAGYDCAWTFEATNDAFFPLAYAAAATTKLEIGTNIAVAFARTPFSMAQTAWDLQKSCLTDPQAVDEELLWQASQPKSA